MTRWNSLTSRQRSTRWRRAFRLLSARGFGFEHAVDKAGRVAEVYTNRGLMVPRVKERSRR